MYRRTRRHTENIYARTHTHTGRDKCSTSTCKEPKVGDSSRYINNSGQPVGNDYEDVHEHKHEHENKNENELEHEHEHEHETTEQHKGGKCSATRAWGKSTGGGTEGTRGGRQLLLHLWWTAGA